MRTPDEIKDRIRGRLFNELMRRLDIPRLPTTCRFNYRHPLDYRKQIEGEPNPGYNRITLDKKLPVVQVIGLCVFGAEGDNWPGDVCDDPSDAQGCHKFEPVGPLEKQAIYDQFQQDVIDAEWLQDNLPDVHELLWVLQYVRDHATQPMGFWGRLWWRLFGRVRIEPVLQVRSNPLDLLRGYTTSDLRQLSLQQMAEERRDHDDDP